MARPIRARLDVPVAALLALLGCGSPPPRDDGWEQRWTLQEIRPWIAACGDGNVEELELGQQRSVQATATESAGPSPGHRICTAVWNAEHQRVTSVSIAIVDLLGDAAAPRDMGVWVTRLAEMLPTDVRPAMEAGRGGAPVDATVGRFRVRAMFYNGNPRDWEGMIAVDPAPRTRP
jgi:hypothetical protein